MPFRGRRAIDVQITRSRSRLSCSLLNVVERGCGLETRSHPLALAAPIPRVGVVAFESTLHVTD